MIDDKTKHKLLKELEKNGNVYVSCMKVNIDRSTYYRWYEKDRWFKKKAKEAVKRGRENNCDVGEHALMAMIRDKNLGATKYLLSHNSPRYKPKHSKNSTVKITHQSMPVEKPDEKKETLEDWLDELDRHMELKGEERLEYIENLKKEFKDEKLPKKPDGGKIQPDEYPEYEAYIRNWIKVTEKNTPHVFPWDKHDNEPKEPPKKQEDDSSNKKMPENTPNQTNNLENKSKKKPRDHPAHRKEAPLDEWDYDDDI